jgi:hypothetical protein
MLKIAFAVSIAAGLMIASPAGAQGKGRKADKIPPGQLPAAGMCRIWIDGVPPGQQPAATDCATAQRNRPANARVLYGDDNSAPGKGNGKYKKGKDGVREDREDREDRDRDRDRNRDARNRDDRNRDRDRDDRDRDDRNRTRESNGCVDLNRDGKCDFGRANYPRTLPQMNDAVLYNRGRRSDAAVRWLGAGDYRPRYSANANGVPTKVTWTDAVGGVVQVWTDTNSDGRADRVDVYRNGKRVGIVQ